jgi:hypothetical protein
MTSKLTLAELKKRLRNVEKKREELGCNERFPPLYNKLDCNRLNKTKERTEEQITLKTAAKKAASSKKTAPIKKAASSKKTAPTKKAAPSEKMPGRPRGRPPMPCEDIAKKVLTKDPVKKQATVDKKCAKRASKSFPPYKCTNVDGKCMTISKVSNNPLFQN